MQWKMGVDGVGIGKGYLPSAIIIGFMTNLWGLS